MPHAGSGREMNMMTTLVCTLAMFQALVPDNGDMHWLMIFVGVAAFGLLLQSIVIVVAGIVAKKTQDDVLSSIHELKAKAMPIIAKAEALIAQTSATTAELTPAVKDITAKVGLIAGHIDVIAGHVEKLSALVQEKAEEFAPIISAANVTVSEANETVREATRKTQEQIARVNGMVTTVLDSAAQVGKSIKYGISLPGREAAGIASGFKAAFEALTNRRKPRPFGSSADSAAGSETAYPRLTTTYHSMGDVPNPTYPRVPDQGTATPGETVDHIYATDKDLSL